VSSTTTDSASASEFYTLEVSGQADDTRRFSMLIGSEHPKMPASIYRLTPSVTTCGPMRDEERRPFIDVQAQHMEAVGQPKLTPGKPVETELGNRPAVIYLGRARHFLHDDECQESNWLEVVESRL
jgi:hypothetical protein